MKCTLHSKLLAIQDGLYQNLVFENLDEPYNSMLHFVTTTKVPNWNGSTPEIGDIGFLECEYVTAGEEYYERSTGNLEKYKYNCCYFISFIKDKEQIKNTEYKF